MIRKEEGKPTNRREQGLRTDVASSSIANNEQVLGTLSESFDPDATIKKLMATNKTLNLCVVVCSPPHLHQLVFNSKSHFISL